MRSETETRDVLVKSFVNFKMIADHAFTEKQEQIATEAAGHCLWALGIEEYAGYSAVTPDPLGETLDGEGFRLIQHAPTGRTRD